MEKLTQREQDAEEKPQHRITSKQQSLMAYLAMVVCRIHDRTYVLLGISMSKPGLGLQVVTHCPMR